MPINIYSVGGFLADYLLHQEKQKIMNNTIHWCCQMIRSVFRVLGMYNFDVCINAWEKKMDWELTSTKIRMQKSYSN